MKLHKNSQKRIIFKDAVYFITSHTLNYYPYFRELMLCDLFAENLRLCKSLKGFLLYGWFLGYDHFHLLIQSSDRCDISNVMQFLKTHISRNLNIIMGFGKQTCNHKSEGGIGQSRLRDGLSDVHGSRLRDGLSDACDRCRLQLSALHQFDIFVRILKSRFRIKYLHGHPFPKFQWYESFHDHYIRNDWDFNDKMGYIAWNPEKHNLSKGWAYIFKNPKYEDLIDES